jgi:hypothetical protein
MEFGILKDTFLGHIRFSELTNHFKNHIISLIIYGRVLSIYINKIHTCLRSNSTVLGGEGHYTLSILGK